MSLRRTPRTLAEMVAWVEERLRSLDSDTAISPTDTRYLYDAKGDVLFAADDNDPRPLHLPPDRPGSAGTWVIAPSAASEMGVAWVFVPFASVSTGGGGTGGGGGGGGAPAFGAPAIALGPAAVPGAAATVIRSDATIRAFDDGLTPSTQAFGDAASDGTDNFASRQNHKHGMPADPVPSHVALSDPHSQYQRESEKDAANGYPSLDAGTKVPTAEMGTGVADATTFLRGDRSWQVVSTAAYDTIEDEGTPLTQRSTANFTGEGVTASDDGSVTVIDIPDGGAFAFFAA